MKKYLCGFVCFVLMNLLVLGCMQVYKVSYNTMNSEHIQMASISQNSDDGKTELKILDRSIEFEFSADELELSDTDKYTLYAILGSDIKNIVHILYYIDELIY